MMNNSKSLSWLRGSAQPPATALQDKTGYYTNQQQKHSTQNIQTLLKIDENGNGGPKSQSTEKPQRPASAAPPLKAYVCCRDEGQMLYSSEETANCSHCGQFYIFNANGTVTKALREKGKEFALDFPIAKILQNMRQKSQETVKLLSPHSTYLNKRKQLVDWISGVGESLQITSATIHHCVLIMDLYTSIQQNVQPHDLQLIAITCLMISTKFHEMKYPSASSLNSATRNAYSYDLIISKEGEILATINWDLLRYTVLDYVHMFINQGCLFETDSISAQQSSAKSPSPSLNKNITAQNSEYLRRYAEFFTDFCIQEESFLYVNQLFLACAIIGFSRRYSKVSVIYPRELELMTGVSLQMVKQLYHSLEQRYYECFPDQKQQSAQQTSHLQSLPTSETSIGVRKQSSSKTSLQLSHHQQQLYNSGSSNKKTQPTSHDKSSTNNSGRPRLLIDVETPDKDTFEFGTIVVKSNDKLSSQKTNSSSLSNPKQRNPSQVAQLRLTTNPPDSVKKFAIKKSIIGALENAAHSTNLTMLQAAQEQQSGQQPVSTTSRNKSAIGFGLHRVTAALKQSFNNGSTNSHEKHPSMDKRQSQHNSFVNDQSTMHEAKKQLQNSKSQVQFANIYQRQTHHQPSLGSQMHDGMMGKLLKNNNGSSVGPQTSHTTKAQTASKLSNNYLTIDVSGNTPVGGLSALPQSAIATMQTMTSIGSSTNRDAAANRIPRQKVLNIKMKENQFVPMTATNKDRDSFKFTTSHMMQKMLNGHSIANQNSNSNNGSISTRNLSMAQLNQNKEAALGAQNQLILQRYHLRANGNYSSNHDTVQAPQVQYNNSISMMSNGMAAHRPGSTGYPMSTHQSRMNSSMNKSEIVKQLNLSRERLNSLLQNTTAQHPPLSHHMSHVQLRGTKKA